MSKKQKLIERLKTKPKNFSFDEMESLLCSLGFVKSNKGRTSGSRVKYVLDGIDIRIHRPHPGNILKYYQVVQVLNALEREGLI